MMRRAPAILAGLFVAITLARVAALVGVEFKAGWLAWLFSIGLGATVYTSSFLLRWKTTRMSALVGLVLFVVVDGYFNLVDVLHSVYPDAPYMAGMLTVAAWAYGIFPTAAAAVLGYQATKAAQLPSGDVKIELGALWSALYAQMLRIASHGLPDAQKRIRTVRRNAPLDAPDDEPMELLSAEAIAAISAPAHDATHVCGQCGASFDKSTALASHVRWHHPAERRNGKV